MSPIVSADIVWRLSGGAANVSPAASLGGVMSADDDGVIVDNVMNNLWDDVSGAEATVGDTEFRGVYVVNEHATLTLESAVVWIEEQTASPDTAITIAVAAEGTMATIATETDPPTGVVFSSPATKDAGLALGDLSPGEARGIWIRRVVSQEARPSLDNSRLRVEGVTSG